MKNIKAFLLTIILTIFLPYIIGYYVESEENIFITWLYGTGYLIAGILIGLILSLTFIVIKRSL